MYGYNLNLGAGGNRLPPGAIMLLRDGIDIIGLSISDATRVNASLWPIIFNLDGNGQPVSLRDSEDIVTDALASVLLNNGTMIGREGVFVALYDVDTPDATLIAACRYAKAPTYPGPFSADIFNGLDTNGFIFANPPAVPDQDGALRISAAGSLACEGGLFVEASSTWSEKTPAPTKKPIRTLTGSKTVYADTDPTAWKRATVNPTKTNKCTCRKINPTDTTNVNVFAGSSKAIVSDSAALSAAGKSAVCTSGNVYELTIPQNGYVTFSGATGNTNKHSVSCDVRLVSGTAVNMGLSGTGGSSPVVLSAEYSRVCTTNITPTDAARVMQFSNTSGDTAVIRCILPQLEEGAFCTAPIITAADPLAPITRTGTAITKPTADAGVLNQNVAFYMRFSMMSAGQDAKFWSSYTDANNCLCLETMAAALLLKKIVAGVTTSVSLTHSHAANAPTEILAIQSDMGMAAKFRTYTEGAWLAWSAWVDVATAAGKAAAVIGAAMELGAANSTGHMSGNVQLFAPIKLGSQLSLANYKAIVEQEVNKINA